MQTDAFSFLVFLTSLTFAQISWKVAILFFHSSFASLVIGGSFYRAHFKPRNNTSFLYPFLFCLLRLCAIRTFDIVHVRIIPSAACGHAHELCCQCWYLECGSHIFCLDLRYPLGCRRFLGGQNSCYHAAQFDWYISCFLIIVAFDFSDTPLCTVSWYLMWLFKCASITVSCSIWFRPRFCFGSQPRVFHVPSCSQHW